MGDFRRVIHSRVVINDKLNEPLLRVIGLLHSVSATRKLNQKVGSEAHSNFVKMGRVQASSSGVPTTIIHRLYMAIQASIGYFLVALAHFSP